MLIRTVGPWFPQEKATRAMRKLKVLLLMIKCILFASRFSVLDDVEESKIDDYVIDVAAGKDGLNMNDDNGVNNNAITTQPTMEAKKASSVRATHQSKNSQKATSESFSQQAKVCPSVSSKRTFKKHH